MNVTPTFEWDTYWKVIHHCLPHPQKKYISICSYFSSAWMLFILPGAPSWLTQTWKPTHLTKKEYHRLDKFCYWCLVPRSVPDFTDTWARLHDYKSPRACSLNQIYLLSLRLHLFSSVVRRTDLLPKLWSYSSKMILHNLSMKVWAVFLSPWSHFTSELWTCELTNVLSMKYK